MLDSDDCCFQLIWRDCWWCWYLFFAARALQSLILGLKTWQLSPPPACRWSQHKVHTESLEYIQFLCIFRYFFCSLNKERRAWFLLCETQLNDNYYYVCNQKKHTVYTHKNKQVSLSKIPNIYWYHTPDGSQIAACDTAFFCQFQLFIFTSFFLQSLWPTKTLPCRLSVVLYLWL